MSIHEADRILNWAAEHAVQDVAFLGGEPTLHPQLAEFVNLAKSVGIPSIRLTTNASARFLEIARSAVIDDINFVYISLDGATDRSHDTIRGSGSFARCIEAMQILAERSRPFGITHTVNTLSLGQLDAILALAERSGCRVLNVHWLSPTGRASSQLLTVPVAKWLEVCDQLFAYQTSRHDLAVQTQAAYIDRHGHHAWTSSIDSRHCAVRSLDNLQFMPDGRVFVCGLLVEREDLHAFRWSGQGLQRRGGESESTIAEGFKGEGCPVRCNGIVPSSAGADSLIPVCIYERIYSPHSESRR
jgi:MoaA/NifB/PqqE/SkfB family radical SAM enzyme